MGLLNDLTLGLVPDNGISGSPAEKSRSQSTSFNESLNQALSGNQSASSGSSESASSSLSESLSKARAQSGQSIFAPQADFLSNQFLPQLSQLFGQDPNSFLAGFNPNQIAGQQASLQAGQNLGGGVIDPSTAAFQDLLGAGGAGSQSVQDAIQAATNPIFQNFEERIAPSIRRALGTEVGQAGGSRGGLQLAKAGQDALRTAGDVGSQVALQAQQQGLGAQQGALNFAPQLAQLFGQPGAIQQGVGGIQQQQQQRQLNAPIDFMSQIQALLGSPTVLGQSTSATDASSLGSSQASSAAQNAANASGFNVSQGQSRGGSQSTSIGGVARDPGIFREIIGAAASAGGKALMG